MRFMVFSMGALVTLCLLAAAASATEGTVVRGMFGPRVLGGPVAPQPRTMFDRGIQRGPSGEILGLSRNQRVRDPWGEGVDAAPSVAGSQWNLRGRYDPQSLRSSVPDVWPTAPPVALQPAIPPTAPPAAVPFRPAPRPVVPPPRPADTWFRAPRR